jgi:hypothetical protein
MGYRDDLIQQMQQDGTWNTLPSEQQTCLLGSTDEQVRQYLVRWDDWDMGEPKAMATIATASLVALISSFKMSLVAMDETGKPTLSKAGTLLAKFVRELRQKGLDVNEIEHGFTSLHSLAISSLTVIYQKLDPENRQEPEDKQS